jgi:hypothetical protein
MKKNYQDPIDLIIGHENKLVNIMNLKTGFKPKARIGHLIEYYRNSEETKEWFTITFPMKLRRLVEWANEPLGVNPLIASLLNDVTMSLEKRAELEAARK